MQLEIAQLERPYEALRIWDRARHRRLVNSLLEAGQKSPVAVVTGDEAGRYVLIDGYARVRALRELARDEVEAVVLALGELEALLFCHSLQQHSQRTALEEGWWLLELVERHGTSQRELARRLDRTVSWVSRRVALVRALPDAVQEAVRAGVIAPQGAMKYLVPLSRANGDACRRLVSALGTEGASVREIGLLYAGWKEADASVREALLDHPRLYLQACRERSDRASAMAPPENPLADKLEAVAGLCRRVRREIRAGALEQLRWPARQAVLRAWQEVELLVGSLRQLLEEQGDVGSGHPHGDLALAPRGAWGAEDRQAGGGLQEHGAAGGA
jgi:ParB/RepB/Spo0J family partition protein